jgi:UDP-2,3-diacylglucosamine pyrophosphatase LpxH
MAKNNIMRVTDAEALLLKKIRENAVTTAQAIGRSELKPAPNIGGPLDLEQELDDLDLPWGHKEVEDPYVCSGRRVGVISDVHVPSHDKVAVEAALRFLKTKEIDTLIINGDFMDMYQISSHDKDPMRRITFGDELEEGRLILGQIRKFFGKNVDIIYQEGNHEERYGRFLPKEMAGDKVRGSSIREQLDLHEHNILWVGDRRGINLGKLRVYHGHEMKAAGVNPTRSMIMKAMHNVVIGHLHRQNALVKPRLDGGSVGAWVTGCLCDLRPHYAVSNEWGHGFAFVEISEDGTFALQLHSIINGKVL